jgi:hypothetical protein
MLRWGDHSTAVEQAIAQYGRPGLYHASGICTTVLGRMPTYEPEQCFKPETWAKLAAGIQALEAAREPLRQEPSGAQQQVVLSTIAQAVIGHILRRDSKPRTDAVLTHKRPPRVKTC